ncbi:protein serine/threonine phosphatase 2C [Punctularia strigosozonata HHB-11173 SS5]|uniref:protein serine/threonine phosphatase 2C n=1 Tax=Punctularia strigosozonata (strain HHB-11173) TaxID=741275 RepID=UPI0004417AFE|nr:protein serine/threonine phosphatase 2C [Punctularia strigosozonata HHB-11173 SS5]EIN12532.1 protein serine/threonine phosphatase 2C [Punctularia strigosozonata HHB-11173 SS5]
MTHDIRSHPVPESFHSRLWASRRTGPPKTIATPDPATTENPHTWLLQAHAHSEQGHRPTMEDVHAIVPEFGGIHGQGFFAVYDGHGGSIDVARYCGEHLHEVLLQNMHQHPHEPLLDVLRQTFLDTDEKIKELDKSDPTKDPGSTAAVAVVRLEDGAAEPNCPSAQGKAPQRVLYCANVGDSRVVLCRAGTAVRLTRDHLPSHADERARIEAANGNVWLGRVQAYLAISRSFGDHDLKQWVIAEPYTTRTVLEEVDEFMIIACDGLWDVMSDQEAVNIVRAQANPGDASSILVRTALDKWTSDNVTVVVVRLSSGPQSRRYNNWACQ